MKKQFYVIAYDVCDAKNRKTVSDLLREWGGRVNYSVFECEIPGRPFSLLKKKIQTLINPQTDIVLYYPICLNCRVLKDQFGMPVYRTLEQKLIVV